MKMAAIGITDCKTFLGTVENPVGRVAIPPFMVSEAEPLAGNY